MDHGQYYADDIQPLLLCFGRGEEFSEKPWNKSVSRLDDFPAPLRLSKFNIRSKLKCPHCYILSSNASSSIIIRPNGLSKFDSLGLCV